jgi:hypothetical protein
MAAADSPNPQADNARNRAAFPPFSAPHYAKNSAALVAGSRAFPGRSAEICRDCVLEDTIPPYGLKSAEEIWNWREKSPAAAGLAGRRANSIAPEVAIL